VLLVIDQFEQWLHGRTDKGRRELVEALRQCDGGQVQCLLLVRDDFWLGVSRFLDELEIPLNQGHNTGLVDLFDVRHARQVLAEFGRAFDRLPAVGSRELTTAESDFLDRAVAGMSEEGRVISVRLALFAEMVKDRPWTSESLHAVGGSAGIGVAYLEETFCSRAANPQNRMHERAARAVLESLLPDAGSPIKGSIRAYSELLDVSGYGRNPRAFKELMRILDSETRLLTPAESPVEEPFKYGPDSGIRYYQLTHDYLVPSLRSWLKGKQLSTRSGRAELRLAERARLWNARPEGRQLPSLWEWLTIRLLTRRDGWSRSQRRMMHVAARRHATVVSTLAAMLLAFLMVGTELTTLAKDILVWFRAGTAPIWLAFGQEERIWPLLLRTEDPTLRTHLVHQLDTLLIDPDELVARQAEEDDASVRRALLLAVGEMGQQVSSDAAPSLAMHRREPSQELVDRLVELYHRDTDPGIHSAAEWALRRHGQGEVVERMRYSFPGQLPGDRQWYVTSTGHTMMVIPGPVQFLMGSPASEAGRQEDEHLRVAHIRRSFSIASKETTIDQFRAFLADHPALGTAGMPPANESPWVPQTGVSWYQAAAYCNWLSRREGIPESQWCYLPNADREYAAGMSIAEDASELRGYRLPTEAEWEYACRAGCSTAWFFGKSDLYLPQYVVGSSSNRLQPLDAGWRKPNDFGLFDMLGNAAEWCQDRYDPAPSRVRDIGMYGRGGRVVDQELRVARGGSFQDLASNTRCATRASARAGDSQADFGFRVARSYP
jgi:formylglycine-generating enzyme required for sulfatase activity